LVDIIYIEILYVAYADEITEIARMPSTEVIAGIYVRVSTSDQTTDAQESELKRYAEKRGWSIFKVYADKGHSGIKQSRPALDELMADCRRGKVDVVLVWKFDRFARSLKHLIAAMEEFRERSIEFVLSTEQIDTSTSLGKCFFQIIGAIGEFERDLIRERVRAGLRHARERGKRLGRPPVRELSEELAEKLKAERALSEGKASFQVLAKKYGVTLYQAYKTCRGIEVRA
jgi:DNA invertase Pin-like site-specific DNA recombinase